MSRKLIGQLLVERNLISPAELLSALALQRERKDKIGRILLDLGYLAERDLLAVLSEQHNASLILAEQFPAVPLELEKLSYKFLKQFKVLPLDLEDKVLTVAMADPSDTETLESIRLFTGYETKIHLGLEHEISDALERFYGSGDGLLGKSFDAGDKLIGETLDTGEDIEHLRDMASEVPVIRMVNLMISRAVERRASDIHIEPFEKEFRVRYRIDGILYNVDSPPVQLKPAIISRVKLMAKLNIAERRLPQDGRIKLKVLGKEIDLRVSTLPTLYGESVVMRILDKSDSSLFDLQKLGFPESMLSKMEKLTSVPHGILLVTGPTGSGKSTTLYSAMKRINLPDKKIITIEDPVEYQMDGINQIHVNTQIGLTFAAGLRHIVRQDPDVIMIGEIRDLETAEIAIRSALTGHLVFSTLHTNDAPSAITRLVDMGVENYLLSSCLIGVLAQRLVRIICKHCKTEYPANPENLRALGLALNGGRPVTLYKGAGCESCGFTGYESRKGIFELMEPDDEIRKMVVSNESSNVIAQYARSRGMKTLKEDGLEKVLEGVTTLDEVLRVTQDI
ncbi:MAG: type II secretion system protein GspE [Acidobacteria bacterium]|nr:MAG: type II secretion system protein GspE [Acidobacteriota bacterium]